MQNESQNIEYKESWGRGFKKIAEEFERACLPLPTIEENGGGVMAIIQRKTVDDVIAARDGNVGNMSVTKRTIERNLSVLQKAGIIRHEGRVNAGVWVILEHGNTNS